MSELFLHIGHAKCATSFLQRQVFPKLNLDYLGRHGRHLDVDKWVNNLTFKEKINIPRIAAAITVAKQSNCLKLPTLISHEVLLRPYKVDRLVSRLAELQSCVGKINIIISIRRQIDLIFSRYIHDRKLLTYNIAEALDFNGTTECLYPYCYKNMNTCYCRQHKIKFINIPFYNYLILYRKLTQHFDVSFVVF